MTVSEFLAWDSNDRSGRRWQLRDGTAEAMAPATENHGAIQAELTRLIGNHLLATGSACRVIAEPGTVPRARAAHNVRIPDLAVTCTPPSGERMIGNPVLVMELLSPSNTNETWANVWTYTTIPSAQEVLIVSSTAIGADLLWRLPDGAWPAEPVPVGAADTLRLDSIGLDQALASLYRTSTLRR